MKRREFGALVAAGTLHPAAPAAAAKSPILMKLGCQSGPSDDKRMQFFARHSVKNICGYAKESPDRGYPTVDELKQLKEVAAKWSISVDMLAPSFLASSHIDRTKRP